MTNLIINLTFDQVSIVEIVLIFVAAFIAIYALTSSPSTKVQKYLYGTSVVLVVLSFIPNLVIEKYSTKVLGEDYRLENQTITHYISFSDDLLQPKSVGMTATVNKFKVDSDTIYMNCGKISIKECLEVYQKILNADTDDQALQELVDQMAETLNKEEYENHLPNEDKPEPVSNFNDTDGPSLNDSSLIDRDRL